MWNLIFLHDVIFVYKLPWQPTSKVLHHITSGLVLSYLEDSRADFCRGMIYVGIQYISIICYDHLK